MSQNQSSNQSKLQAATSGASLLGPSGAGPNDTLEQQILESLDAKLDLILANQARVDQVLVALGLLATTQGELPGDF